jgi:hypothetical protein
MQFTGTSIQYPELGPLSGEVRSGGTSLAIPAEHYEVVVGDEAHYQFVSRGLSEGSYQAYDAWAS